MRKLLCGIHSHAANAVCRLKVCWLFPKWTAAQPCSQYCNNVVWKNFHVSAVCAIFFFLYENILIIHLFIIAPCYFSSMACGYNEKCQHLILQMSAAQALPWEFWSISAERSDLTSCLLLHCFPAFLLIHNHTFTYHYLTLTNTSSCQMRLGCFERNCQRAY